MSTQNRPKLTRMTICDLCDEVIPDGTYPNDTASVTNGYLSHPFTQKTKWAWLTWPQKDKPHTTWEQERENDKIRVEWDFHAECLVDALRRVIDERTAKVVQ